MNTSLNRERKRGGERETNFLKRGFISKYLNAMKSVKIKIFKKMLSFVLDGK